MADRKSSVSSPDGKKVKIEIQQVGSETAEYWLSQSEFESCTYADLLNYLKIDKEGKIFNYSDLLAEDVSSQYCTICKVPGHGINICLRPYVPDWPGYPINGLAILQRPLWMPPLYHPQEATLHQFLATVRRQRRASFRRQQMQMYMPVPVPEQPLIVPAPSIYRGKTGGRGEQPICTLCAQGHDVRSCTKLA